MSSRTALASRRTALASSRTALASSRTALASSRTALASSPIYWYTDTRIRSLKPRSSLSGQDVILPAYQVH